MVSQLFWNQGYTNLLSNSAVLNAAQYNKHAFWVFMVNEGHSLSDTLTQSSLNVHSSLLWEILACPIKATKTTFS